MRKRTIALLLMATTALATVAVLGVASAQTNPLCTTATVLSGSNFEIDTTVPPGANLKVNDTDCIDWLNAGANTFRSGVTVQNDTASGATDESFGQGTAEDNPNPTLVDGSIPPNKSDLKAFGVFQEGDEFLELFWTRVQAPKGTTNMDFELNQNKCEHVDDDNNASTPAYNDDADPTTFDEPTADSVCANNGPNTDPGSIEVTPVRLAGDKLVAYDLSKGGDDPTITIHTWIDANGTVDAADHWDDGVCLVAPAGVDCEGGGTDAAGSVNTALLPATETGGLGPLSPFTFGEAVVSFEALFGGTACGEFGSAYLKSRSSDSFTAEIKDFVPPKAVQIGNCETSLSTDASNSGTQADPAQSVGGTISDSATLGTDVPNGTDGEIVFTLYKFAANATIGVNDCTAANQVLTYAGDGTSEVPVTNHNETGGTTNPYTSASFTTTEAGKYQWVATFTPAPNQGLNPSSTPCGDTAEQSLVINATSGITTTQKWLPQDTATVNAPAGTTGTVVFTLYENGTCTPPQTGTPVTFTDSNGAPYETDNTTYRTASTTISWKATFTPTTAGVDPSTSGCEVSNLTITN